MEAINATTYKQEGLGDVKPKIIIGGKDVSKFVPNVNMSFAFGGAAEEFFVNINRSEKIITNKVATLSSGVVSQTVGIEKDEFYVDKNGKLKFDTVFISKPPVLKLVYDITFSAGVEFFYQGELTSSEIAEGVIRPENVVGSYAVYCNKKHNKYKTGKLFHIYRQFVVDANGAKEWCDMEYKDGKLTVTLPKAFMDKAVYPVRLDPTFGYNTAGGSSTNYTTANWPRGCRTGTYTASTGDTITNFHFYGNSPVENYLQMAAYSFDGGYPDGRLGSITTVTSTSDTAQWWTSSDVSIAMSNGVEYGVSFGFNDNVDPNWMWVYFDTGAAQESYHNAGGDLPATWTSGGTLDRISSVYATYTEGGGTIVPIIDHHYQMMGMM